MVRHIKKIHSCKVLGNEMGRCGITYSGNWSCRTEENTQHWMS